MPCALEFSGVQRLRGDRPWDSCLSEDSRSYKWPKASLYGVWRSFTPPLRFVSDRLHLVKENGGYRRRKRRRHSRPGDPPSDLPDAPGLNGRASLQRALGNRRDQPRRAAARPPRQRLPARPLDEAAQASRLTQQRQRQSGSAIQGLTMVPGVVRRDDASVWRVGGLCTAMQLLAEAEH